VASAGGLSAATAARTFEFSYASSDPGELVADPAVDALVIATRHDTHASLTAAALAAGKAVFCEKPLALSWPELEQVAAAWAASDAPLLVGFNRRHSELARQLADWLPEGVARAIVYRVNAGATAPEHWTRDPLVGGGRALGELCHFLDLSCFLAEAPPLHVSGELLGGSGDDDSALVQVAFGCGSVAAVQYLANGDPSVPKERLEVFCDGVATIDDFRSLELARNGKRRRVKARGRAKGHGEEVRAFVTAALGDAAGGDVPGLDAFWSSALTLQAQVALSAGHAVPVSLPEALGGAGADA
jgi:predicted dehydrogenase